MKKLLRKIIVIFAVSLLCVSAFAQRPGYPAKPPIEERGYEDWYTFKYGESFSRDPWTWGYTKEFADKHGSNSNWRQAMAAFAPPAAATTSWTSGTTQNGQTLLAVTH